MNPQVLNYLKSINNADSEALKALSVGGSGGVGAAGQNLVREDLERVSRNALWGQKAHQACRRMPEFRADNYENHQFSVIRSYGSLFDSAFVGEFGRARRDQFRGKRKNIRLGTLALENAASFQANLSNVGENLGKGKVYDTNTVSLTRLLMALRNIAIWHSDTRVGHASDTVFKGVFEQHEDELASAQKYPNNPLFMPTTYCVDMRGAKMSRSKLEDGVAPISDEAWGSPTDLACHPRVMKGFKAEIQDGYKTERVMVASEDGKPIRTGQPIQGLWLLTGNLDFYQDLFIGRDFHFSDPVDVDSEWTPSDKAPATPAAPAVAANANVAGSLFQAVDVANNVALKYKLQAISQDGFASSVSAASAASNVAAAGSATVSWNSVANVAAYDVLRNSAEFPDRYFKIGRVKNTGAALTFTDKNHLIPGTDQAAAYEMALPRAMVSGELVQTSGDEADNVLSWAYLGVQGAQQTLELARLGLYQSELLYMMGAPMLSQPKRLVRFINIGNR